MKAITFLVRLLLALLALPCAAVAQSQVPSPLNAPTAALPLVLNKSAFSCPTCSSGVASVSAFRAANFTGLSAIDLTGYTSPGDGGGGQLSLISSGCTDNGITVFKDSAGNCFARSVQQPTIQVQWGGAHCDGQTVTHDGAITISTNQFSSSSITFDSTYIGKKLVIIYAGTTPPWVTTIAAIINSSTVQTADNAPATFPGTTSAGSATYKDQINGGDNIPGSGIGIGDAWTAIGGTGTAATGTFTQVQYVCHQTANVCDGTNINSGGTGYSVNETLLGTCSSCGANQLIQPIIQVASISGGGSTGPITGYTIVIPGLWSTATPPGLTWSTPAGSGFTTNNLSNNGSWGAAGVSLTSGGSYSVQPMNPVSVTDGTSGSTNATVDLHFTGTPEWAVGTDDTTAIQNVENFIEAFPVDDDDQTRALGLPQGAQCFATGITVNHTVSWRGGGPNQSRLIQIPGSSGTSVGGSPNAFVTLAPVVPTNPSQLLEAAQLSWDNFSIESLSTSQTVTVGSTPTNYPLDGVMATSPSPHTEKNAAIYMNNVFIQNFPRNELEEYKYLAEVRFSFVKLNNSNNLDLPFSGTSTSGSNSITGVSGGNQTAITSALAQMSALNLTLSINGQGVPFGTTITGVVGGNVVTSNPLAASGSIQFEAYGGGDCLHAVHNANPTHITGLILSFCNDGQNLIHDTQWEEAQVVAFENNIGSSYSGFSNTRTKFACVECQFAKSNEENAVFDQVNGSFSCDSCMAFGGNTIGAPSTSPASANFAIGADAEGGGGGTGEGYSTLLSLMHPVLLGPTDPLGGSANTYYFMPNASGHYCDCNVDMDGMTTQEIANGLPITYPSTLTYLVHVDGSNLPSTASITCYAAGGQTNAVATYSPLNIVTTAASSGASCLLPPADGSGYSVIVSNQAATNAIDEYAAGSDTVNGAAFKQIAAGASETFRSYTPGSWVAIP